MIEIEDAQLILDNDAALSPPRLYRVHMHNDDYTTMDFVVRMLVTVFDHDPVRAEELMLHVHRCGQAVCGHYPYDVALSKVVLVHNQARSEQYPLRCTLEAD